MFDFFKRKSPARAAQPRGEANIKRNPTERRSFDRLGPLPTPDVTEGNDEADWSLWEDSVAFQDSQMSSPYPETLPVPLHTTEAKDSAISEGYDTIRGGDL